MQIFCPLVLVALVAVCYYNSLRCDLVFDDLAAVRDNRDLRPHIPIFNIFRNDFWGTPIHKEQSHKSYRPLTVLSFRLNYAVHGLEPMGYHLVNVMLHLLVCFLFYKVCLHLLPPPSSFVSSSLFAVHPVHTEAVTGVVGRSELLSAAAFLCALLLFLHRRCRPRTNVLKQCGLTAILAILGMLCKEQAITVLAVCCIYELSLPKNSSRVQSIRHLMLGRKSISSWWKDKLQRLAVLSAVALLAVFVRWKISGGNMPVFSRFDNPASVSSSPTRQLTYNYLLAVNAWLLLFPCNLCCDWTMSTVPLLSSLLDFRNVSTIVTYIAIFCILRTARKCDDDARIVIIMSTAIAVLSFVPASNLFFPVGFVVAERVLYIPSMGFCMLVAQGWNCIYERRSYKNFAVMGIIFLIIVDICKTIKRNDDWQTEYTLYRSSLDVNQRNGKLYNNMGQVLESLNRLEEALYHYETAKKLQPDDVRSYLNIGHVLTNLGRNEDAEEIYRKAQALLPGSESSNPDVYVSTSHLQVFLNLALLISQNTSRLEEADQLYREAITLRYDFTKAYLNRGEVLLKMNRTREAEVMYHRALEYDDANPDLYFNLGVVLMDQGRNKEALEFLEKALEIEPDHEKSLELSAILMQASHIPSHKNLAKIRLEKIIDRGKETERVYINLGLVAVDNKNYPSAEKWFRKALQKDSSSREALFNLALLLSEQQRQAEAVFALDRLLEYYPGHVKGLLLLADMNVNFLKDLDTAEQCYRKVLKIEPENQKALHNLCVVYFERQHFETAERCFARTLALHPDVPYIAHHLDVVRSILRDNILPRWPHSIS